MSGHETFCGEYHITESFDGFTNYRECFTAETENLTGSEICDPDLIRFRQILDGKIVSHLRDCLLIHALVYHIEYPLIYILIHQTLTYYKYNYDNIAILHSNIQIFNYQSFM